MKDSNQKNLAARATPRRKRCATPTNDISSSSSPEQMLTERIKELEYIHSLNLFLEEDKPSFEEIFQRVVTTLPSAFQHAERAWCRITFQGKAHAVVERTKANHTLKSDIHVHGQCLGAIEVGYDEGTDGRGIHQFLPEEYQLLQSVSMRLADTFEIMLAAQEIHSYQAELRSLILQRHLVEEKERHRIAIHLHDSIGQGIAVAKLKLEALLFADIAESEKDKIRQVMDLLRQTMLDARSLMVDLSPPILYEAGLGPAIEWLSMQIRRQFGLRVITTIPTNEALVVSEDTSILLFRAIKELLTNTVKHAHASRASVSVSIHENQVSAVIEDDGEGFNPAAVDRRYIDINGFGLFSIREELTHCGGTFLIEPAAPHGTRITMSLPLARPGTIDGSRKC